MHTALLQLSLTHLILLATRSKPAPQSLVNANYTMARVDQEHDHVFTMSPTSGLLLPGASETVKVTFVPGTPGVFSSEMWRITTPGGVATTVTLRGLVRALWSGNSEAGRLSAHAI